MSETALQAKKSKGKGRVAGQSKSADKGLTLADLAGGMTVVVDSNTNRLQPINDKKRHPDTNLAASVATMALAGFTQKQITDALRISSETLLEHYRFELENGRTNTMAQVVGSLAQRAIAGSDAAAIFLAKARLGWSDRQSVELTGKDGGAIQIEHRAEILQNVSGILRQGLTIDDEAEPLD